MRGLTGAHHDILEALVPYDWRQVPMEKLEQKGWRARPIRGRRTRLKELNDLGLIHVRTVSVNAWFSKVSDPPLGGYHQRYVEAVLTDQGQDVRDAGRPRPTRFITEEEYMEHPDEEV